MSQRKHVPAIESFFASNQSQTESEKNDTEDEQCINQEETDGDQRKPEKSLTFQKTWLRDHTWLCYEEAMFCRRICTYFLGHCRNVRGLAKSMVVFSLFEKLTKDIQMKQLNLRVLTKNRGVYRRKMANW